MAVSNSVDRFNGLVAGLAFKAPVVAVASVPITLSGNQTVGGVAVVTDDRVLVIAQADPIENGIYNVDSSAWKRAADFDGNRDVTGGTRVGYAMGGVDVGPVYIVNGNQELRPGVDPITFNIGDGFFLSQTEVNNSITLDMINGAYYWGDVLRYKALIDAIQDDTFAFNIALGSGHPSFCSISGIAAIEGRIVQSGPNGLVGGKTFTGHAGLRLERFSSNDEPIWQTWGTQNKLEGNSMQMACRGHDLPKGFLLLGADPEALSTDPEVVDCHHNRLSDIKFLGDADANIDWIGPAVYTHAIGRKRGAFTGVGAYYNTLLDLYANQTAMGFEFSTDANFNRMGGCTAIQWTNAAFHFNASYGNRGTDLRIESPNAVNLDERFAIHYGVQNDEFGLETDTDSGYPIYGAWQNKMSGSAELTLDAAGGKVVRLVRNSIPAGTHNNTYEENYTEFGGVLSGGLGRNGRSDDRAIGFDSDVETGAISVLNKGQKRIKGHEFRTLDQGPGAFYEKRESWALVDGRESGMVASTDYDLLEIDQIGNDLAGCLIKFTFAGKADSTSDSVYRGEIWWAVSQNSGVDTATKIFEHVHSFGDTAPFDPVCVASDGSANPTQNTKARVSLSVGAIGASNAFCSWRAEILHSNLQDVNLDYDADIRLLSGFFDESLILVTFNVSGTLDDAQ